ncbi:hypothetical protein [Actinoplanes auranticolor]|uniref:Uncharacterized protein n=1 Tax=Actinoplanes auranticolor TaxID=47988 RepID=A0A919VWA6_9ACTN|nr:hypothetical protein [Actinoplanes auranticolor]GIM79256.1 hypothetical protein Aau02nite_84860 [Actinoplanes auranticolor]
MLIADGGGGYGGTHWTAKEVPAMWAAVANQDTEAHFQVVGGWSKTADLTLAHLAQVRVYRDNLASVWPPSKSPAAAAYIARLDKLMADLQATHDAASANYTAFSTVTLTLSLARQKLKTLYEKYESNAKQNYVWQQKQAAAAASPTPTPTPSPSPGPSPTALTPPVSAAQQEELNRQARVIMYDLSSTLLSGQAALQKPKPYNPSGQFADDKTSSTSGSESGSGFATPPIIPPPGASSGGTVGLSNNSALHSNAIPVQPTTNVPAGPGSIGVGTGTGPVLGGTGTTPVITPPTPGTPPITGPATLPAPSTPGVLPGIIGPNGGQGLVPPGGFSPNGSKVVPGGSVKPGIGAGPAGRLTIPSGGVIGANPGSGMIGQMPAGGPGTRPGGSARPNPVGGVIGQQGGSPACGSAPANRSISSSNTPFPNQTAGRHPRRDDTESTRWDPDNPWVTEEGVTPIVLPPSDQGPIDPGPAIGYSR